MLVKSWLGDFLDAHVGEGLRDDGDLWHAWMDALIGVKAIKPEAEAAARQLDGTRFDRPADYLAALLTQIGAVRATTAPTSAGPGSKDERYAEAAKAINEVGAMTPDERLDFATRLLDRFAELGWVMEWHEDEGQFRTVPIEPGAPQPDTWLSCRLRALRPEIYAILGHPLPGSEPLPDLDRFDDPDLKVRWRRMVEALGERVCVP